MVIRADSRERKTEETEGSSGATSFAVALV